MITNNKIQFTKNGLSEIKKELETLIETKQPQTVERVARARDFGDLSENSEYHAAREELSFIQGRINELEEIIKRAKVVKRTSNNGQVGIGCKVTVETEGKEHTYEVVGEWEADPMQKRISHTSPLGKALSGKKVGEKIELEVPAGKVIYKIKKIH